RVNQAGEFGAQQIYKGQLAILKDPQDQEVISHMLEQEQVHLKRFNELVVDRKVRPTALSPLWNVLGFALGASTAILGKKAAMACTVAVEEVIDEHYQEQLDTLKDNDKELTDLIEKCQAEELEHRDIGLEHGAEETPGYTVLSTAIKGASKLAIWLSKRV
ncbi:MAG: demethoxyubiquinone hydroxylase family protein, partial [Alphaproteobacteria bacterium]